MGKLSLIRIVLLIPVGGGLWWTLVMHTGLGFSIPMWISALVALAIDSLMIHLFDHSRLESSLSQRVVRGILIAVIETAVAAIAFTVFAGIFAYFVVLGPEDGSHA